MVGTEGLEPPTSTTSMWRSSQLSYVPSNVYISISQKVTRKNFSMLTHIGYITKSQNKPYLI